MSIVVKAKIKEIAENFNVSGDFTEALDKEVRAMVKKASERAEANGRRTIMSKDI